MASRREITKKFALLGRLVRFNELGRVAARASDEVRSMSAATIDRYLKPHKDARYPQALGRVWCMTQGCGRREG